MMAEVTNTFIRTGFFFLMRAWAFTLACFILFNVLYRWVGFGLDPNWWWIDMRFLPTWAQLSLLLFASLHLLWFSILYPNKKWTLISIVTSLLLLEAATVHNTVQYFLLVRQGTLYQAPLLPFSFWMGLVLLTIALAVIKRLWEGNISGIKPTTKTMMVVMSVLGMTSGLIGIPLLQMLTFGRTDYRRKADVIVVFGAHTYKNGQPSLPLINRVRTACELYHQWYARKIIVSGGPGDGDVHETKAMKKLAIELGVHEQDILIDEDGINTQATVADTLPIFRAYHMERVLVVSDFSHLVRIKLAYGWEGKQVYTVPAKGYQPVWRACFQLIRETAALWVYYARGLIRG